MNEYEVIFESERIKYIKLTEKLIDDYLNMVNDPEVSSKISHHPRTYTSEEEKSWIDVKLKSNAICYSMIEKGTNKYIGNIEIDQIKDGNGEVGISITREMQDKHFGTEAMKAIVEYGYNTLNLNTIYLNALSTNLRAIKCYKNAGFIESGVGKEPDDIHMIHKR